MSRFRSPLTGRGQVGDSVRVPGLVVAGAETFRRDIVKLMVQGAPAHCTNGGRPITVETVEFDIALTDDGAAIRYAWVSLWGRPRDPSASWVRARRHPNHMIERRIRLGDTAPQWLRDLLDEVAAPLLDMRPRAVS